MTKKPNNSSDDSSALEAQNNFLTEENDASSDWKKAIKRKDRKRRLKKAILITGIVLAALIIIIFATFFILHQIGKRKMLEKDVKIQPDDAVNAIFYDDATILYNGVLYGYNKNVTGILLMGVDRENIVESDSFGTNGQADTIMLVTVDTATGHTTVTGIPRDTITDVDIYSKSGSFSSTEKTQLCLAYAYGDGKTLSCENTVKAVSKLFMGMPINSYFSSDYTLVSQINDVLGGITVVPNESFEATRPHYSTVYSFESGNKYKLYGANTLPYLRYRGNNADSSYLRLERQIDYITDLTNKIADKSKADISYPVSLFKTFSKNGVSNLTADKIAFLSTSMFSKRNNFSVEFKQLKGEQIIGEDSLAEFHPDKVQLFELVLELFYKPIG